MAPLCPNNCVCSIFFQVFSFPQTERSGNMFKKRKKDVSLPQDSVVESWEIPPKRAKLIIKLSALATSLLHLTGKLAFSSEMCCTEMAAFSWHLWGQRGSTSPGILMVILRQSELLLDCTIKRKISIEFLLCGVRVGTFKPRV